MKPATPPVRREAAMIGPGMSIRGTITGDEDLEVQGRVEGAIQISRDLHVAPGARVAASVDAAAVTVQGRLQGEVTAAEGLVVEAGAVMVGDVSTPKLVVADGAHFKGRVQMDFEVPALDAPRAATRRR
ncbi:MAG: polymer-forming cytoskeletal protein [bacterium]